LTLPFSPVLRSRLAVVVLVVVCLVAAGCGDDSPGDYDDATREAFMSGCVEDDTNADLVEVCECTYDTAVEELPFEQFKAAEQRLQEGSPEVADEISEIILDCIRQVSARRS
jgi:hypothetical protein